MKEKLLRNLAMKHSRAVWYVKQLLPLFYVSHYRDGENRLHFCQWRMWFGRCFFVDDRVIVP